MRQIDQMTDIELDILKLKGMLRDSKPVASEASCSSTPNTYEIPSGHRLDDNNTETPTR